MIRRLISLGLLCMVFCVPLAAGAANQLDLHYHEMLVATDGTDSFFFIEQDGAWAIQSASDQISGFSAQYVLPAGSVPFGLFYADASTIWYGVYSQTLMYSEDNYTFAAIEIMCLDRASGRAKAVSYDADPQALFPVDGTRMYYLPWNDTDQLCAIDFTTGKDYLVLEAEGQLVWMAAERGDDLYVLLLNPNTGEEMMYRINNVGTQPVPDPDPIPFYSNLMGEYRLYTTQEGDLFVAALGEEEASQIDMREEILLGEPKRYGSVLFSLWNSADGSANLTRVELAEPEKIQSLYFEPMAEGNAIGYCDGELWVVDGAGRLLRVNQDFTKLETLAQLDAQELANEGVWKYTLPFEEYVLLLGYEQNETPADYGISTPPTLNRIIPINSDQPLTSMVLSNN